MTVMQLIFLAASAIILVGALMVVTRRNLVQAALYLVLTFFGVAVLFAMLEAGFFAVIQVLVYIGAIAILMLFAVMLTRHGADEDEHPTNRSFWLGALVAALVFEGLVVMLSMWPGFQTMSEPLAADYDPVRELGVEMLSVDGFLLPFEVVSVLLTAALIGAIVIAWLGEQAHKAAAKKEQETQA